MLGAVADGILYTKTVLEREMNTASDNPLIFTKSDDKTLGEIVSGGNFHGEYVAKALDMLAIYAYEAGAMSYVRMKRLLNEDKSNGLPAFLVGESGLCSGMMTWENVAAALNSENKVLVHPASCDSAETCADKEDHVSMGGFAARKAVTVCKNVLQILAVELFAAVHAIHWRYHNKTHDAVTPH